MRTDRIQQLELRILNERRMLRGTVMTLQENVKQRLTSPTGLVVAFGGGLLISLLRSDCRRHDSVRETHGSAWWLRLLPSLAALGLRRFAMPGDGAGTPAGSDPD